MAISLIWCNPYVLHSSSPPFSLSLFTLLKMGFATSTFCSFLLYEDKYGWYKLNVDAERVVCGGLRCWRGCGYCILLSNQVTTWFWFSRKHDHEKEAAICKGYAILKLNCRAKITKKEEDKHKTNLLIKLATKITSKDKHKSINPI
jgi:hypothetical protein